MSSVRKCIQCKHNFEHNGTKRNGLCGSNQTVLNCSSFEPIEVNSKLFFKAQEQLKQRKEDEDE